jgi:hypothetical protein
MTPHESQQHGQRTFAAINKKLGELSDTRVLYCETSREHDDMKSNFHQLQIQYEDVTCCLVDGRSVPGFRISTASYIFLATINLVNTN